MILNRKAVRGVSFSRNRETILCFCYVCCQTETAKHFMNGARKTGVFLFGYHSLQVWQLKADTGCDIHPVSQGKRRSYVLSLFNMCPRQTWQFLLACTSKSSCTNGGCAIKKCWQKKLRYY